MITNTIRFFYPDLKKEEVKKFGLLSLAFFFLVGAYWMLRLLKDTIFFKIAFPEDLGWIAGQGGKFQPIAKTYSVFVVILLVLIYSKLVDIFEKHVLFYIICSFYTGIFATITGILLYRDWYGDAAIGKIPLAAMGWASYFAIESFGSIVVALFWSFVASITDTEAAKKGYPLIIAGAQIGSIGGSVLTIFAEELGGIWRLLLLSTIFVATIMAVIYYFMKVMPESQLVGNKESAKSEKHKEGFIKGFVSGITLLLTRSYLLGILVISTFYEVVGTIIDYQMKRQAEIFPAFASETGFAKFMGIFGAASNGLAFLMALLGTSYLMKRYGLTFCLLLYPVCLGIAMTALFAFYTYGSPTAAHLLWATFGVMMLTKGLSYAVNNPSKEMMYIPTSKDAKFKSKGWIDSFGGRVAKMGGAQVSNQFKHNLADLMLYGSALSLGLIGIWIYVALYVGRTNRKLIQEGKIVG
ncbi:hypothetical protein M1446_03295 [Candidatus Dependentiae bacterium]|nr:hypothetical protein [Candidatus Dependentiae bacterium]